MTEKKKSSISTKKGDKGQTSLYSGDRVSKASARPQTYGTLDEASAMIGLARAKSHNAFINDILLKIQNLIYLTNGELACPTDKLPTLKKRFKKEHLEDLDKAGATLENKLNLPPKFIIYGETEVGAVLDVARAMVRRAERALAVLDDLEPLENPHIKPFINRLSDILYLLARFDELESGQPMRHPD